jgi:hypothetical protein
MYLLNHLTTTFNVYTVELKNNQASYNAVIRELK